jgi:uncharacterized membrane protein YjdF
VSSSRRHPPAGSNGPNAALAESHKALWALASIICSGDAWDTPWHMFLALMGAITAS